MSGSAVVVGAVRREPFLPLAVPTCRFPEPQPPARAAIKGPSVLVLGGSKVVAKGLCPYLHVLVALLGLYVRHVYICVSLHMYIYIDI